MKRLLGMCLVGGTLIGLGGCAGQTPCTVADKTIQSALVGYNAAQEAGDTKQIDKYKWTLDAAVAIESIWCAGSRQVQAVK